MADSAETTVPTTGSPPQVGDDVELTIDSFAHGGNGVGRVDGYVLFVRGGVPGDRVRARVTKRKRSYGEALAEEVVEPSPHRVEPRAPHAGAPWQVLPYERQLAEKQRQVSDAMERIGRFSSPPVGDPVAAVAPWGYRNKVEYSFGPSPEGPDPVVGFHRAGRWDEIDEVRDDVLASERVNALRERVVDWCRQEGLSGYDRVEQTGLLRNLVVREGRRTGSLQARLVTGPGDLRTDEFAAVTGADSVLLTREDGVAETPHGGETRLLAGEEWIEEELTVAGRALRFRISPEVFFQTNTEMAERLYSVAIDLAGLRGSERVFDLYCGIGTITLSLAGRAGEVWGIESIERAVADAISNASRNGVDNARFFAGDVRTAMRPLLEEAGRPDVVVVDPPRPGLSQKVVRRVLEAGAERIVYVSCNPTTLAPNARQIADAGYRLAAVTPVDMFPQTPHVECVALLERDGTATP